MILQVLQLSLFVNHGSIIVKIISDFTIELLNFVLYMDNYMDRGVYVQLIDQRHNGMLWTSFKLLNKDLSGLVNFEILILWLQDSNINRNFVFAKCVFLLPTKTVKQEDADQPELVERKWIFKWKWNEKDEVARYKHGLWPKNFYKDMIFTINLVVHEYCKMHLMNVVSAYLYDSLDHAILWKNLKGSKYLKHKIILMKLVQ